MRGNLTSYAAQGWTIIVESQFYLLFPFLMIFTKRYGAKYLVGLLLVFILTKAALWNAKGSVQALAYYSIFGRMDQFLIGMITALFVSAPKIKQLIIRNSAAVFASGLIIAVAFFWWFHGRGGYLAFDGQQGYTASPIWIFVPSIEGIAYALVIVGYLHLNPIRYTRLLSSGLAYIGRVSYSIYLLHLLIIPTIIDVTKAMNFTPKSWEQALLLSALVAMPILVAASTFSYYLIELPFMQLRSSASRGNESVE